MASISGSTFCHQWLGIVTGVIALCSFVRTQPVCIQKDVVLDCVVNTNEDFVDLSSVAENLRVTFKQGHSITFVDSLFPRLPALKTLTLDLQHVRTLSTGRVFQQLDALQSLTLENTDPYRPLPELSLTAGTLSGLQTLQKLTIGETGLTEIQTDAFRDLTNLTDFSISRNQIPSLPDELFASTKLQTLSLTEAGQLQVSGATLQGLDQLTTLNLMNNQLQLVGPAPFQGMPNLEELNLENNELLTLPVDTFQGLGKLVRLQLNENNFTVVEVPVFDPLISLNHLDLTDCKIEVSVV